jgi:hypothetical protein
MKGIIKLYQSIERKLLYKTLYFIYVIIFVEKERNSL